MRKFGGQIDQPIKRIIPYILLLFGVSGVQSSLMDFPNNVVSAGYGVGDTTFKCKSDLAYELKWFIQPNGTAQRQSLANGTEIIKQATSYCNIQNEEAGEFTLILKIQYESAQTYTCLEPNTNEERSAELVIIGPTKFEKDMNESHMTLKCSVNFRGNWAPELELSHNGISVVEKGEVFVTPNQNVSTILIIPRNDSASAGNYSCTTRFDIRGKPKQTTDNSVPSYMETLILTIVLTKPDLHPESNPEDYSKVIAIVCSVFFVLAFLVLVLCWRWLRYKNKRERAQLRSEVALQ